MTRRVLRLHLNRPWAVVGGVKTHQGYEQAYIRLCELLTKQVGASIRQTGIHFIEETNTLVRTGAGSDSERCHADGCLDASMSMNSTRGFTHLSAAILRERSQYREPQLRDARSVEVPPRQ